MKGGKFRQRPGTSETKLLATKVGVVSQPRL